MSVYKNLKKLIKKGDRLKEDGDLKAAIKLYKEALTINPFSKIASNHLAIAYKINEQNDKAIKVYKKLLKIDSEDEIIYESLGKIYEKKEDYTNAIEAYKKAIKIRPDKERYKKSLSQVKKAKKIIQREAQEKEERDIVNKLKQIVKISDRIKLDTLKGVLNIEHNSFEDKILDWANKFRFKIDKDVLVINQETVNDFIEYVSGKSTKKDNFCLFCGKKITEEELIIKKSLVAWKCSECGTEHKN